MNAILRSRAFVALSLVLAAGCADKTMVSADAGEALDAGPAKPVLGGKLGAALAAAESQQGRPQGGSNAAKDGPPENGIFPPGGADAALAPSAPPKIEVINDGSEPRVALALAPVGDEQKTTMTVGVQLAQGPLPGVDFELAFKIDRPKDKDKVDPQGSLPIVARVISVEPPKELARGLPKELVDFFSRFKGSELRYQLSPKGVVSGLTATVSKDVEAAKVEDGIRTMGDITFRAMVDSFMMMNVPLPDKPVGVGGYWIVTDRGTSFNMDVVRYRVFHVQKIDKGQAALTVDIRQYSVKEEIDLGALAKGTKFKLDRFDSQGKGVAAWSSATILPPGDEVSVRVMMAPAGQRGAIPLAVGAKTSEPEKSEKTDKKK